MQLVIEAFELDRKTNIVYSHKIELGDVTDFISLLRQRRVAGAADECIREVKKKQKAAAGFAKTCKEAG